MDIETGRSAFEIRPVDRDYSGLSIADRYLADAAIERSFFNGANLTNCAFAAVKMNNTEFSEAKLERCLLINTDLTGSDFVDSLFENTSFFECNFEKGEWRDAVFNGCSFIRCNFGHTTVTLCRFVGCQFDTETIATMEHRAIYFNVFSRCTFGRPTSSSLFSSRNFGVEAVGDQGTIVSAGSSITIEQMCLLNNIGHLRVLDVAGVAESICAALSSRLHRRTSALNFFSKIIRVLTDERRISPTSLIFIEELIAKFGSSVHDQDLFTAAMTAIVEIRSALFSVAAEGASQKHGAPEGVAKHITIHFDETYAQHQAEVLRETLANIAHQSANGLILERFQNGSTLIELACGNAIAIGTLFVAINFALRQARITVDLVKDLRTKLLRSRRQTERKISTRKALPRARSKVPAVMKIGPVLPELAPVRAAVKRHGRVLVQMDERADIVIRVELSAEQVDGR